MTYGTVPSDRFQAVSPAPFEPAPAVKAGGHRDVLTHPASPVVSNEPVSHYTLGTTVLKILAARQIRREQFRGPGAKVLGRPGVWFTARTSWEPTATKGIVDRAAGRVRDATVDEMLLRGGALARIRVSERVVMFSWRDYRRIGRIDPNVADAMESVAREKGSDPGEWRVSLLDVPLKYVVSVDAWDGERS